MYLFSVCLHFLRCRRSCGKKSGYCKVCSRVSENTFYGYNAFLSLNVAYTDDYLNISSSERIDLDVFLNKPAYFPYCFTESAGICSDFEVFSFAWDLFVAFCSVLVRMYYNRVFFRSNISAKFFWRKRKLSERFLRLHIYYCINFLILIICFFMSFLICLVRLLRVTVLLYVLVSQNLVHFVRQKET